MPPTGDYKSFRKLGQPHIVHNMKSDCSEAGEDVQNSQGEEDDYGEENPYCIQDSYPQLIESAKPDNSVWEDNEGK